MATKSFKVDLRTADIPFIQEFANSPVLIPNLDKAGRMPRSFYGAEDNVDYNAPYVLYGDNVLPTSFGFQGVTAGDSVASASVGLKLTTISNHLKITRGAAIYELGLSANLSLALVAKSPDTGLATLPGSFQINPIMELTNAPFNTSGVYTSHPASAWSWVPQVTSPAAKLPLPSYWQKVASIAYFGEHIFVVVGSHDHDPNVEPLLIEQRNASGSRTATFSAGLFTNQFHTFSTTLQVINYADASPSYPTLYTYGAVGLTTDLSGTTAKISSVASAHGYLLISQGPYFRWGVAGSAVNAAANFAIKDSAGVATGAGFQQPEALNGAEILRIIPVDGGVLLFSATSCVSATYTGDADQPWIYRLTPGAGGYLGSWYCTDQTDDRGIYAYTTVGLQYITINSAKSVLQTAQNWVRSKSYPSYVAGVLSTLQSSGFIFRLHYTTSKKLLISYGVETTGLDAAPMIGFFIYDEVLQRWGHVRLQHSTIFSAVPDFGSSNTIATPDIAIATTSASTTIHRLSKSNSAALVLSDVSLTRDRFTEIESVTVRSTRDDVAETTDGSCKIFPSYDVGLQNTLPVLFMLDMTSTTISGHYTTVTYRGIVEGKTLRPVITGYSFVDIVLETVAGSKT